MEKVKKQNGNQEILTFKTQDGVTVTMYGKPNFEIWAKEDDRALLSESEYISKLKEELLMLFLFFFLFLFCYNKCK
jgi:hypothetical protein